MFTNKDKIYDVAIVGAGPAGVACAVQLKRQGIEPLLIEKNEVGGLLRNANLVENYPGFPAGVVGTHLAEKMREHLAAVGVNPVFDEVAGVRAIDGGFEITGRDCAYRSKFLVVASGTVPKPLPIEGEGMVFYEICELYKYETAGKKVVIVGSGDAAFDYALNLAGRGNAAQVVILNRNTTTKCLGLLKERVLANPKINYVENEEPLKFTEGGYLACKSGREFPCDYVLCAVGRSPCNDFLNGLPEQCDNLFLIGDVKNGSFRQASIAAGDGVRTAMEILHNYSASPVMSEQLNHC